MKLVSSDVSMDSLAEVKMAAGADEVGWRARPSVAKASAPVIPVDGMCLAISPDSRWLAASGPALSVIVIFHADTMVPLRKIRETSGAFMSIL